MVRSDPNMIKTFKKFVINPQEGGYYGPLIAAANAITILVAANVPFVEENLQNVKIPDAIIRDGVFTNCDFTGADLTNVNMKNCKLQGCNFSQAILKNVDLGVYPSIHCLYTVTDLKTCTPIYDDKYLISVHKNSNKVILWDYLSPNEKIEEYAGQSAAFHPQGLGFAIGVHQNIQIWSKISQKSFKLLRTLEGHNESVIALEYTPDFTELISGSVDKTVRLWEVSTGHMIRVFQGHLDQVNTVAYCPQFSLLISGSNDKSILLWEKETGKLKKKITDHQAAINYVGFFRNGENFIAASDDLNSTIRVYQSENGYYHENFEGIHTNGVKSIGFSSNGSLLVSVSKEKMVVLNHSNRNIFCNIPVQGVTEINCAIFGRDDKQIINGGNDKYITFTDCTLAKSRKIYEGPWHEITSVAISPDGSCLVSGGSDNSVKLWNTSTGKLLKVLEEHKDVVTSVAFSPNGLQILSGSMDCSCILWNKNSGNIIETFKTDIEVKSVAFSMDGSKFACASGSDLKLFSISNKKPLKSFEGHHEIVTALVFSPDGHTILSSSLDNLIILWDLNGVIIKTFRGHKSTIKAIAFSPDGLKFISAGLENDIKVWNIDSGELDHEINAHYLDINSICYSPDGTEILSGSNDNKMKIFNENYGNTIHTFDAHSGYVIAAGYSKNGSIIYSAGLDNTIRIWKKSTKGNYVDYLLAVEISQDETPMKCNDMVLTDVKDLSEFNQQIFLENGAKKPYF